MRNNIFSGVAGVIVLSLLVLSGCEKPPAPMFSYSPETNPEAGEAITFTNESLNSVSYAWDFGDGSSSTDESPQKTFTDPGNYTVVLTATNEGGTSNEISKAVFINNPTILGFDVYESDTTTLIEDCEVWLYDNETDFNNLADPQFLVLTDSDGYAEFRNLEAQTYYAIFYKEMEDGFWITGGNTGNLTQNQSNLFYVICEYHLFTEVKKSAPAGDRSFIPQVFKKVE